MVLSHEVLISIVAGSLIAGGFIFRVSQLKVLRMTDMVILAVNTVAVIATVSTGKLFFYSAISLFVPVLVYSVRARTAREIANYLNVVIFEVTVVMVLGTVVTGVVYLVLPTT